MSKADLAINGGPKAMPHPASARFATDAREKAAVDALLDEAIRSGNNSGYNGPEEEALGREFAELMGGGYADGVNGGTNAVYVALRALNPEPFSEVIVGAVTDPGGMMPIPVCNCIPAVADVAPDSYNTCAEEIEKLITPLTAAIIVPHIAGEPADMRDIMALANRHGIPVIEDCAQSHYAKLDGKPVGTWGTIGAFSTMFGKHFCTGGQGGMVFTKTEEMYWKIRQAADRGKPFGLPAGSTNCIAAINCNLQEIGAAIGRVQLKKLPSFGEKRRAVAAKLAEGFAEIPSVRIPKLVDGAECVYWFWRLGYNGAGLDCTKDEYCAALAAEGVNVAASYRAALPSTQDWFKNRCAYGTHGFPWTAPEYKGTMNREFALPNAMKVMDECYNLYLNESWTDEDIANVLAAYRKVDAAFRA
ncbi:MAG: DegT/DnrJ/EryC1/StrS family aminotransferase [Clostridiales bacterium]|nr:DegT/DnrJ/EryC1/StrS family aminotransferase [Clostridiales bacterium]